jgi:hypothetical protein
MVVQVIIAIAYVLALTVVGSAFLRIVFPLSTREAWISGIPFGSVGFGIVLFIFNYYLKLRLTVGLVAVLLITLTATGVFIHILSRSKPDSTTILIKEILASPIAIAVIAVLTTVILTVFLSPTESWDSFIYHLPYAKILFTSGFPPTDVNPSYSHMEYAYPPSLFYFFAGEWLLIGRVDHILPRLTHLLFLLPALWWMVRLAVQNLKLSVPTALASVVFLLTVHTLDLELFYQNTDLPLVFFTILAVKLLLDSFEKESYRFLVAAGTCLAYLCWIKYTGIAIAAALGAGYLLMIAWELISSKEKPKAAWWQRTQPIYLAFTIIVIFLPFLVRNTIEFDNPVYPILAKYLHGPGTDTWSMQWILNWTVPNRLFEGELYPIIDLFGILPLQLAIASIIFRPAGLKVTWRFLSGTLLLYLLLWTATMNYKNGGDTIRYTYAVLPLASLLAASTYERLLSRERRIIWLTTAVSLIIVSTFIVYGILGGEDKVPGTTPWALLLSYKMVSLAFILLTVLLSRYSTIASRRYQRFWTVSVFLLLIPLSGLTVNRLWIDIRSYSKGLINIQSVKNDVQADADWINSHLPPNAVLLTFESRRYWLPRELLSADQPELRPLYELKDFDAAIDFVCSKGANYIYINGWNDYPHPLFYNSILFEELDNNVRMKLIYDGTNNSSLIYQLGCR